jgi:hypothetical protein
MALARLFTLVIATVAACGFLAPAGAAPILVDVELVLAIDVSGSISDTEFASQREGYVQAFQSLAVKNAITGGPLGRIAATVVYWSGASDQLQVVPWSLIDSAASADAFAAAIAATSRSFSDATSISEAITFSAALFGANDFTGRQVIDVSSDGKNNETPGGSCAVDSATCLGALTSARDAAGAAGIQINGLPITAEFADLDAYFKANVVRPLPGAFTVTASNFDLENFGASIQLKLAREVTTAPSPETLVLLGLGLLGVGLLGRYVGHRRNRA